VASERTVSVELSVEETQALLQEVPAAYQTQINDILLTALAQSFARWTGERSLLVELEGHGREDIFNDVNLSRTVGWFTTHFPVLLDIGEASNPGEALKAVKEQLRRIPNRGIGYSVLRYLNENRELTEQLQALPQPEVKFNYLGQFDQVLSESSLFAPADESCGQERSLRGSRNRLLVINGLIVSGQLRLDWKYSENVHHRSTIESLSQSFVAALRDLITHCQSPEAGGYTPSDFPQMQFSPKELDELLAEL
jgi:non-ribosomal peptide synthase protein (TIGR01720 family)